MNRTQARTAFDEYVHDYDAQNPRIALKVAHTLRVAALCERIAESLGLAPDAVDRAWLAGLLHDIGRFEQVRRFDSFNDAATVAHARLSEELLFGDAGQDERPLVRRFVTDDADDMLLRCAIATHSDYRLPEGLAPECLQLCQILRDADKIDILAVNVVCPIEDIYGVPERAMVESLVSPECVRIFFEHRCIPRGVRQYPADIMLGHICFAWELVYPESLRIVAEQGHLEYMLSRHWANPSTQEAFDRMAAHMHAELHLR